MKDNSRMILKSKVIESVRAGVRKQVIETYQSWASGFITKDEFECSMWDIRFTADSIVTTMGTMDVLSADDVYDLCRFIYSLTETY